MLTLRAERDTVPHMARDPDQQCVTLTLPKELVKSIDRQSARHSGIVNRSHFIREVMIPEMLKLDDQFAKRWHSVYRGL